MSDFAANLDPTALGLPSEADLVAAFRATPGYEAMAKAEAEKQARIAAYKAANPEANDFQARYYGGTDEDRARIQAMYPGTFGKLHKSMYYSGAAPAEGQSVLDYMLANNGAMPETKVKEGPGLGQALLNAALLAAAGFGVGTIGNALMAGAGAAGTGAAGAGAAGAGAAGAGAAGAGAAGAGAAGTAAGAGLGAAGAGLGAAGAGAAGAGTAVSELVITAAASGMTIPQIAAAVGIPAFAVFNVLQNAAGSNVLQGGDAGDTLGQPSEGTPVDELVITADKLNPATWTDLVPVGALGSGMIANAVSKGLGVPQDSAAGETIADSDIPSDVEGLTTTAEALGAGSVAGDLGAKLATAAALDKAATVAEIAGRVLPVAGLLMGGGDGSGSSGGGGGIPPGFATAGTPGSLSDRFRAQLPAPSGPFGNLAARNVSMTPEEWKTYGARPEQSFFANVPIRPSGIAPIKPPGGQVVDRGPNPAEAEPGLAVNLPAAGRPLGVQGPASSQPAPGFNPTTPSSVNSTSVMDMNRSGMTAEQFAVAMKRMEDARRAPPLPKPSIEPKFAKGGFAVRGPGTGRSDEIPARLSDGEYVIDAETVALLGDGSTQAGSKRLDEFRANIRKHKGRQLSKGKFSHNAKRPEAYLHGGRA